MTQSFQAGRPWHISASLIFNRLILFLYSLKSLFSFNTLFFYLFLRFVSKHCFFPLVLIGCKTNEKFSCASLQIVTTAVPYAGIKKKKSHKEIRREKKEKWKYLFLYFKVFLPSGFNTNQTGVHSRSVQVCLHRLLIISFKKIQMPQKQGKINSWAVWLIYTSNILWIGYSSINQIAGVSLKVV